MGCIPECIYQASFWRTVPWICIKINFNISVLSWLNVLKMIRFAYWMPSIKAQPRLCMFISWCARECGLCVVGRAHSFTLTHWFNVFWRKEEFILPTHLFPSQLHLTHWHLTDVTLPQPTNMATSRNKIKAKMWLQRQPEKTSGANKGNWHSFFYL